MLLPQDQSVPSVLIDSACESPHEILDHVVSKPTCLGLEYVLVLPTPNWPETLVPQDQSVPSVLVAKEKLVPADTFAQVVNEPIWVGRDLFTVSFKPNAPMVWLNPQE